MSEHLPECDPIPYERPCICERLRACEERVENRIIHGGLDASRFNAGLDVAREAVMLHATAGQGAAVPPREFVHTDSLLASIDAMRDKS